MNATYQPGQTVTLEQTYPVDATAISIEIVDSAGDILLGPTPYGISHPALGVYLYAWPIPPDQTPDTLSARWTATVDAQSSTTQQTFTITGGGNLAGTWCTITDVTAFTGHTVTQQDVNTAQQMIEALVRRVWRSTDAAKRDFYWLNRATAWQALYVNAHPEVLTMMDVSSMSQDGLSVQFRSGASQFQALYAPITLRFLNDLFRSTNGTIRFNSAFQKNRLTKIGVTAGSSIPWGNL
jgi:hypothetical protein